MEGAWFGVLFILAMLSYTMPAELPERVRVKEPKYTISKRRW